MRLCNSRAVRAGAFLASCSDTEPQTYTYEETTTPVKESDEAAESAEIAALTIGQLESWRAYPALYTLIHPDVREKISFKQITCCTTSWISPRLRALPSASSRRRVYSINPARWLAITTIKCSSY